MIPYMYKNYRFLAQVVQEELIFFGEKIDKNRKNQKVFAKISKNITRIVPNFQIPRKDHYILIVLKLQLYSSSTLEGVSFSMLRKLTKSQLSPKFFAIISKNINRIIPKPQYRRKDLYIYYVLNLQVSTFKTVELDGC